MSMSRRRALMGYLAGHVLTPQRARIRLLRAAGVTVDRHLVVYSGLRLNGRAGVTLGDCSLINHDCLIDASADVTIGRHAALGCRVSLVTADHDYSDPRARSGARLLRPIVIGDGAWIGAGAMILGGVSIGEGAVIAAGALVRCDVPPHTLWGGVPARQLRQLPVELPSPGRGRRSDDDAPADELVAAAGS
jgi:acetyltransferase-like isoleucine patch superfamily enzyme